jgi:prefoldin alpha subunit
MQGTAETLQSRLAVLQNSIAELTIAGASVSALQKAEEGDPILVPTGGGTYVNANLGNLSKIIVGIGANVSVEMRLDEAEEDITSRLEEVQKMGQSVQEQLEKILTQMEIHRNALNRLGVALRGE